MQLQRRVHTLKDGRSIAFLEWGDPNGHPALYHHGTPSSAVEAFWMQAAAERHGVRLIAIDRPGFGESSPGPPGFDETGRICEELADGLDLERFGAIGFSGGAGHAIATAARCGDRVTQVHVGGGMGSIAGATSDVIPTSGRLQLTVMGKVGPLFRLAMGRRSAKMRSALDRTSRIPMYAGLEMLADSAAGAQLAAVESFVRETPPDDLLAFVRAYADASSHADAVRNDFVAIGRPWPFELDDVRVPVELWHGTADGAVAIGAARRLAASLPNATLHELEGEGHFVFLTHADDVCRQLGSHASVAAPSSLGEQRVSTAPEEQVRSGELG